MNIWFIPKGLLIYCLLYYIQKVVISTSNRIKNKELEKIKILTIDQSNKSEFKENDKSQYEIEDIENKNFKFNFKNESKCIEVKHQDKSIWKYDEIQCKNKYPKLIFYYTDSKTIFISSENILFVLRFEDNKWNFIFKGKPELVELDVKGKKSDSSCEYSKNNKTKFGTFTVKEGYLINAIKRSKCTPLCCNSDNNFWEAENETEYAMKVIVNGTGSIKKTDEVIIYLLNGNIKKFIKDGCCNKSWKEKPI